MEKLKVLFAVVLSLGTATAASVSWQNIILCLICEYKINLLFGSVLLNFVFANDQSKVAHIVKLV